MMPQGHSHASRAIYDLCDLAVALVNNINNSNRLHAEILEGCQFVLLKETGRRLRDFVFTSESAKIIEDLDAASSPGQGIETEDHESDNSEFDAPFLLYILERTSSFTCCDADSPGSSSSQTTRDSTPSALASAPAPVPGGLQRSECVRFQNTLLKAIFGRGMSAGFEPSIPEVKKLEEYRIHALKAETVDVREWFKQEVWSLVGWDVLRSMHLIDRNE